MFGGKGLRDVPEEQIVAVFRALYRGDLEAPIQRSDIMLMGLHAFAESGDVIFGLDDRGARAVLVAVLAERRR